MANPRKELIEILQELKNELDFHPGFSESVRYKNIIQDTEQLLSSPEESRFYNLARAGLDEKIVAQVVRMQRILWILDVANRRKIKMHFRLRPYHPPYIIRRISDMEYDKDAQNGTREVVHKIISNLDEEVELTMQLDDICYFCKLCTCMGCTNASGDWIKWDRINEKVLNYFELKPDKKMKIGDLLRLTIKKMPRAIDTLGIIPAKEEANYQCGIKKWQEILDR